MLSGLLHILFELRAGWALLLLTQPTAYGSIAYEYEKNSYPLALADVLAANPEADTALAFLQQLDPQAGETLGIDLYSGFVLKHQMRKYFYFGEALEPAYRDRMTQAMTRLTQTDPVSHPATHPRQFWERSTDNCATLVDCRNTDNLRAMRETSVYLMAEVSGNEATRRLYKARLERYVSTLLDIGMGEWDSPTYHGHTTAAYLNLYDFAQDPEVKHLAQTALDWLFRSAALKYWRGTWTEPAKRVNGHGAAAFFWLYFGDAAPPEAVEKDWIYSLTSNYQPPEALLRIAHRNFPKPVEIRRTHPHYENWKPGLYGPAFYETLYFGHTFQLGSLAQGTGGDWSGFSLHVARGAGTDEFVVTGGEPQAIAQYRNLILLWGASEPTLTLPQGETHIQNGITFVRAEQTWLALSPFPHGFALEVGEVATHGSFEHFQAQVLQGSQLTVTDTQAEYRSSQGIAIALSLQGSALPIVWRNGEHHDWSRHADTSALAAFNL